MRSKIKTIIRKINKLKLNTFLLMVLGLVILINIAMIFQSTSAAKIKIAAAEELARPANISITIIKDTSCADCADIQPYIDITKKQKISVTKEETLDYKSEQAQKFIKDLDIKKLPTFIVSGELDKSENFKKLLLSGGEIKDGTFKFALPIAPYFDLASKEVKGRNINITLISDKTCKECYSTDVYKNFIARAGILKPASQTELDKTDAAAKGLIKKYAITNLPTLILSGEVTEYPNIINLWTTLGTVEKDGTYVFRETKLVGTYFDLKTRKVVDPRTVAANSTGSAKK